eukprot:4814604-Prymnesium_polylepis.1
MDTPAMKHARGCGLRTPCRVWSRVHTSEPSARTARRTRSPVACAARAGAPPGAHRDPAAPPWWPRSCQSRMPAQSASDLTWSSIGP